MFESPRFTDAWIWLIMANACDHRLDMCENPAHWDSCLQSAQPVRMNVRDSGLNEKWGGARHHSKLKCSPQAVESMPLTASVIASLCSGRTMKR